MSSTLEATDVLEVTLPEIQKDECASLPITPVAAPSYDKPMATRRELWSYYLYIIGNNGLGPQGYSLTLFQGLATAAGYDPVRGPGSSCRGQEASRECVLPWGSGTKVIMTLVLTAIGPVADYRMFGRWLLLISTVICWAAQFASMSLTSPSRWGAAMALYIISFTSRGIIIAFVGAPFPQLARNTPHSRELRKRHERGELSVEAYEKEQSIEKSKISSVSMDNRIFGFVWYLVVYVIFQQPRPGPKLPKGESYLAIGLKQIFIAVKEHKKLPHTYAYLLSIFFIFGSLGTSSTLVSIRQNEQFTFSFLQRGHLSSECRYLLVWGMIGIWTDKIGFHNAWEFWVYNIVYGSLIGPRYSTSQTMAAELSPPGFEYMFFGLFELWERLAATIGSNVIQAVVDKNGSTWKAFPVLLAFGTVGCLVAGFGVNVPKGRYAAAQWAVEQRGTGAFTVSSGEMDNEFSKSEGKI
ncbi:MFS general substrate transporter [Lactarius akahatsu]|uniref:Autophagy-related protein n=1 Tax=Lactarius akahatsu TaxID=416441 RepID=A0AAD4Q451_9AGAM|nr:MFS general substrate transporter [Lactarius akahatsu]